ncbi:MAG: N-acetyltransferase [Bacteroidetes bacterium]|nr:N-acetyltransferase [Bacteroidota bacterium]
MEDEIVHDKEENKFYKIVNGKEAYLRYIMLDEKTIDMIKTYVPPELRGQGIAAEVVLAGLLYAKENGLSIIPTCSYVETYIERHQEFKELVAE